MSRTGWTQSSKRQQNHLHWKKPWTVETKLPTESLQTVSMWPKDRWRVQESPRAEAAEIMKGTEDQRVEGRGSKELKLRDCRSWVLEELHGSKPCRQRAWYSSLDDDCYRRCCLVLRSQFSGLESPNTESLPSTFIAIHCYSQGPLVIECGTTDSQGSGYKPLTSEPWGIGLQLIEMKHISLVLWI